MYQRPSIKSNHKVSVELFPFLSVLACTIGSLILLIVLISSQAFSENKKVTIIPRTSSEATKSKQPFYVELRKDEVILHPSKEYVAIEDTFDFGSPFMELLSEVERNQNEKYIIIAVRPSGYEIFDRVRNEIEQRGLDLGYEPIDEEWELEIRN